MLRVVFVAALLSTGCFASKKHSEEKLGCTDVEGIKECVTHKAICLIYKKQFRCLKRDTAEK